MRRIWDVAVLGSANGDHNLTVDSLPVAGQTVLATADTRSVGGKGLNQAVAASRAGAATAFIGAVGDDSGGQMVRRTLADAGVSDDLLRTAAEPTGEATVVVGAGGENLIVVSARANATLTALTAADRAAIAAARVLVCQLEIPVASVAEAAQCARASGTTFVLNAAPAVAIPASLLSQVDVLIVNDSEARDLARTGAGPGAQDAAAPDVMPALRKLARSVVITRGAAGALYSGPDSDPAEVRAPAVAVTDTTGAGDTFCGVFAAGLAAGLPPAAATARAVAAASWSVQHRGTVASMPTRHQLDEFLSALAR